MPIPLDPRLDGLYVITDAALCAKRGLAGCVEAALAGGARIVQYRDKSRDWPRRFAEVSELLPLCAAREALLLVNDDVELARATGAHGVHLGRDDMNVERARRLLGRDAVVGVSCYDDFLLADAAMRTGASYVAFGSVFPSRTKPDAVRAPLNLFRRAREHLHLPSCAIGGIDRGNIAEVARAGASMAAVISAAFETGDVQQAAAALSRAFASARGSP